MAEIDGKVCVPDKQISKKPQKVSITFMDEPSDESEEKIISVIDKKEKLHALEEVQGLWKNHDNSMPVDDYIRNMRKGRQFDIRLRCPHLGFSGKRFCLKITLQLADALIAATAVENEKTLCTANCKHYKCVPDLKMDVFTVL